MSSDRKDLTSTNEEDDLDGLDDVLDEFAAKPQDTTKKPDQQTSSTSPSESKQASLPSTSSTAGNEELEDEEFDEEAFARELEAQMAALMKTFGGDGSDLPLPGSTTSGQPSDNASGSDPSSNPGGQELNEEELAKQFESLMSSMGFGNENYSNGEGPSGSLARMMMADQKEKEKDSNSKPTPNSSSGSNTSKPAPANYQEALKATMSRLKESDANASASASSNSSNNPLASMFPGLENDEEMKKLLATLSAGGGEGGPDGESPEFAQMLENMMGELMGKEVLYEPMKELSEKYQPFLDNPPRQLSEEDKTRYTKQSKIVKEVVALFENPKFDNGSEEERRQLKAEVGEKMNEMQECGAPPDEVAGEMPEGMEGIPGLDGNPENCLIM